MSSKVDLDRILNIEELSRHVSVFQPEGRLVGPTMYVTAPDTCWLDMEGLAAIACHRFQPSSGDHSVLVNFAYQSDRHRVLADMTYRVPEQIPDKRNPIQLLGWNPLSVSSFYSNDSVH